MLAELVQLLQREVASDVAREAVLLLAQLSSASRATGDRASSPQSTRSSSRYGHRVLGRSPCARTAAQVLSAAALLDVDDDPEDRSR